MHNDSEIVAVVPGGVTAARRLEGDLRESLVHRRTSSEPPMRTGACQISTPNWSSFSPF